MSGFLRPVAVAMALALPAAAQENSALDQLTRREQLLGWEAVGRIDIEGGGFCTGTLIATNLVLTAGHCVFEKDGTPVAVSRIRFRAGLVNGRAIAEMKVARTVADPAYLPTAPGTPATVRHDVALLELEGDIPAAIAAPFVVATPGTDDTVSVVSYAAGREEALSWQKTCQVLGQENGLIAVDCDVSFGSSGAPVLDRSSGRARIVAIISAGYRDGKETVAFGMVLPGIVSELKALLRQGKVLSEDKAAVTPGAGVRRIGAGDGSRDTGARFVKP